MPSEFPALDLYEDMIHDLEMQEANEDLFREDQQVPQIDSTFDNLRQLTATIVDQYTPLPSAPNTAVAPVTEMQERADQEVSNGSSPSHFMELDTCTTMYDNSPARDAKQVVQQGCFPTEEENQMALIMAIDSMFNDCATLDINSDPSSWSVSDVCKWVKYMSAKHSISDVSQDLQLMNIDGEGLCRLWAINSPICNQFLYGELEIWWNHFKLMNDTMDAIETRPQLTEVEGAYLPPPPSVSPYSVPPGSPSSSSSDSTQSCALRSDLEESVMIYNKMFNSVDSPPEPVQPKPTEHKQTIHLWQFLRELLTKPESFSSCIRWINKSEGIFKIEDSTRVAKEWGRRKNRPAMNYDKLSRSIRQYYKKGIIKKTQQSKRLVYQFCAPYLK